MTKKATVKRTPIEISRYAAISLVNLKLGDRSQLAVLKTAKKNPIPNKRLIIVLSFNLI